MTQTKHVIFKKRQQIEKAENSYPSYRSVLRYSLHQHLRSPTSTILKILFKIGSPPANKSAAEVEKAYLEEIVDKTYTTQCGGSKCLSAGLNRLSFDKWKELNGFNTNAITTVRYYNSADLGLGRDMNCVSLANDTSRGKDAMSCYVSNHGTLGGGAEVAFDALGKN